MKNTVIGLLTCFAIGTATLGGAKVLVDHIYTDRSIDSYLGLDAYRIPKPFT